MSQSRSAMRAGFTWEQRVQLAEGDLDEIDSATEGLRKELAATRQVLTGILIAVTTASILLALNLVVST